MIHKKKLSWSENFPQVETSRQFSLFYTSQNYFLNAFHEAVGIFLTNLCKRAFSSVLNERENVFIDF